MFVVSGVKRLALWPAERFVERKHPSWIFETIDDTAIDLEGATIIEGRPGDVIYWPSSWWHTAIGDHQLSAAVAIALLLNAHDRRFAEDLLRASAPAPLALRTLPFSADLPDAFDRAAVLLSDAKTAAADHWLRRYTGFGFETVPPLDPNARAPSTPAMLSPLARLAWRRDGEKMKVAVFGHLFELEHRPELEESLGAIARGAKVTPGSPLSDHLARAGALME
jgi:50S ribosomal protein L16 3-hydroxylase